MCKSVQLCPCIILKKSYIKKNTCKLLLNTLNIFLKRVIKKKDTLIEVIVV